nr:RICIN domain-containing protein [Streptomyces clavuligerus]
MDHVDVDKWSDITFRVDGQDFGTTRYTGTGSRGNAGTLEIGRARDGSSAYGLTGTVGEVRIWGRARDTDQLGTPLNPRDEGLIARWTFEENEGNTTADPAGGHDLKLRRAKWTTDPDPLASSFTVYRNGRPIACDIPTDKPLGDSWGDDQLTLGALSTSGTYGGFFKGTLEEVRLWRTPRTPEQILDSLFTRLKGDKQDLLGYWPFDAASTTPDADAVRDQSLRGNHLAPGTDTTRPQTTLSTAPVSTDTAMVRSALGGIRTPFHETITAPPAATEYADLQYTPDGQMQGVLKRTYTHINDGTWHLTTGYKVGDLITEWVSQIQYDPQLIGYIEGAPPVPSENLTLGGTDYTDYTDYTGASQVTFQQADDITSTLSSSSERSVDTAFSFAAGVEVDEGILLITAPLGIGTAEPIATVAVKAHVGGNLEFSNAWTSETTVSQGTTTERDTTATLTGYPEDDQHPLNPDLGRRWIPNNTGYALVQSETADVYALRLAHTGTLVAYRMLPNPDIPKDWNIITFPLNPQYTKQGTLDGGVGFTDQGGKVFDKAYPNASGYGEYSYFKPREAYALKRRIQRERQELENYYNTVSTETSASDPTADRAGKILAQVVGSTPTAPDKNAPTESAGSFANRNIANTYVWTADGGFFAETTSTVDVVTQTTGGLLHRLRSRHRPRRGHLRSRRHRRRLPARRLHRRRHDRHPPPLPPGHPLPQPRHHRQPRPRPPETGQGTANPLYDQSGKPVLTPGKVDAYRFMTFLPSARDTTNFDDLLQQGHRPHLAHRQHRSQRQRPPPGPAERHQTPLLAHPPPRHLPLPHPPAHPHHRTPLTGERPPRPRHPLQLRTHPPPRPLRPHRRHRHRRPRRRHPQRPHHPPPPTPPPRRTDLPLPRRLLRPRRITPQHQPPRAHAPNPGHRSSPRPGATPGPARRKRPRTPWHTYGSPSPGPAGPGDGPPHPLRPPRRDGGTVSKENTVAQFKDRDTTFQAPDGDLYICLASKPNLVWDMPRSSTTAGTAPILHTRNNGANQRWRLEITDFQVSFYTYFRILNVHSGMALSVNDDNTLSQQPRDTTGTPPGPRQIWAMGHPGSVGNSYAPAKPTRPHPTGSTGIRLRVVNFDVKELGGPVDANPATSGTRLTFSPWKTFEEGWTFTTA